MTDTHERSLAVSPDAIRRRLFTGAAVPPDLLKKALVRLDEQLDATKTELVTHKGEVKAREVFKDNAAVQGAIDKVLSMTGLYVKERDHRPTRDPVEVVVGADGVVRIRIGGGEAGDEVAPILEITETPHGHGSTVIDSVPVAVLPVSTSNTPLMKVRNRAPISPEAFKLLSDEEVS